MPTLPELARYNRWANARLLARCREADAADQIFDAAGGTLGTIEETPKHVLPAPGVRPAGADAARGSEIGILLSRFA